MKPLADLLARQVYKPYKVSWQLGYLPQHWKTAAEAFTCKGGWQWKVGKYSPVGPISVPCKLSEHIIIEHLRLHPMQHYDLAHLP